MLFIIIILIAVVPFRKIGWKFSKKFLYQVPFATSTLLTILWALFIAFFINILCIWLNPNIIIKIFFAYGFGTYLSIPNFALFDTGTLPLHELKRTAFIYTISMITFVIISIGFAFYK